MKKNTTRALTHSPRFTYINEEVIVFEYIHIDIDIDGWLEAINTFSD